MSIKLNNSNGFMNYENFNPHKVLSNKKFMEIANVSSVGNYQYSNGKFLFRGSNNVLKVSSLLLDDMLLTIKRFILNKSEATTELEYSNFKYNVKVKRNDLTLYTTPSFDNILEPFMYIYEKEKLIV